MRHLSWWKRWRIAGESASHRPHASFPSSGCKYNWNWHFGTNIGLRTFDGNYQAIKGCMSRCIIVPFVSSGFLAAVVCSSRLTPLWRKYPWLSNNRFCESAIREIPRTHSIDSQYSRQNVADKIQGLARPVPEALPHGDEFYLRGGGAFDLFLIQGLAFLMYGIRSACSSASPFTQDGDMVFLGTCAFFNFLFLQFIRACQGIDG